MRAATPIQPGQAQPLPEDRDPDRHREERRRAAGDRVDDRQVTAPVGGGKQHEVRGLDHA